MTRRPLSEPRRVRVSCNLDWGEEFSAVVSNEGAEVENVFSHCGRVGGGRGSCHCIRSPSLCWWCWIGNSSMCWNCAWYVASELAKDFGWPFELMEHFAGFGVGKLGGTVPEGWSKGLRLVVFLPVLWDKFCGCFFVVWETHLNGVVPLIPLFGFHRVQSLSLVADQPPNVTMYGG